MSRHLQRTISIVALIICAAGAVSAAVQESAATLQQRAAAGERALGEGRYSDAEKEYEELRRLSPNTAEVHARLGLIYFQEGKFDAAVPALREAIRLKPGLPKVDALLAMSLSETGHYEEALLGVTKAFSQTDDPILRRMAGLHLQRIYTGLGRDQDAVDVSLKLSRLYPDDPEVLYHASRLFANFAYLQTMRLATVAPESVWLHQAAGEANESQGLYDAALREYQQVVAAAPRRPGIRFRIGRTLLERSSHNPATDDATQARKAFEDELGLDPSNANAAYELAEMHRQAGELEPARKLFEQALTHYPDFDHAQVGLARTLIALGSPADAIPHLKAAIAHNPENEVAYYQMAQAFKALGNTAEQENALAQFTRLRDASARRTTAVPQTKQDVTPQTVDVKSPK